MTQGKNTLYESYAGTYNSKGVFLKINKKPQQTLLVTSLLTDGRPAALAHSPSLMTEKVVCWYAYGCGTHTDWSNKTVCHIGQGSACQNMMDDICFSLSGKKIFRSFFALKVFHLNHCLIVLWAVMLCKYYLLTDDVLSLKTWIFDLPGNG